MEKLRLRNREDLDKITKKISIQKNLIKIRVAICAGTSCQALGCQKITDRFIEEVKKQKLIKTVEISETGCPGFCERGPIVVIYPKGIFYEKVKLQDVEEIISQTIMNGKIIDRLLYLDPKTGKKITYEKEIPFYKKQKRLLLGNNSLINPNYIEDYFAIGGYGALSKVLFEMEPEQVIDIIKRSGLRGRGGGGFPTGIKWESSRKAKGKIKYVICNADEGDPGAYMDRSLLEGNPHSIIEGMIIGAYAIGSHEGYVYVRHEYPLAVKNLTVAISQAKEYGLLGKDILGSGFVFDIKISRGGGSFVCGESTALMASLEGKVGEPRAKYIHTVQRGLWNRPSNLNNVETWANVSLIINNGADWYSKIGTKESKGTKIFSLSGKITNTGLVEVPMGITLRELIYDIGGGIPNGKEFKAVQIGGPSGGCIPRDLIDIPVDFEELTKVGSMMGSGGMIIMDDDTCMVDLARYFLDFLQDESCGKCVPCREGIQRMHEILTRITSGKGKRGDIELLVELGSFLKDFSLCALGTTAPNSVLTTINYFTSEYEAHIKGMKCPAGICKDLIEYYIDKDRCTGCDVCKKLCPQNAVTGEKDNPHSIIQDVCIKCNICKESCKDNAIIVR
jgi:NADH-quinone oxidoreductase subunit F